MTVVGEGSRPSSATHQPASPVAVISAGRSSSVPYMQMGAAVTTAGVESMPSTPTARGLTLSLPPPPRTAAAAVAASERDAVHTQAVVQMHAGGNVPGPDPGPEASSSAAADGVGLPVPAVPPPGTPPPPELFVGPPSVVRPSTPPPPPTALPSAAPPGPPAVGRPVTPPAVSGGAPGAFLAPPAPPSRAGTPPLAPAAAHIRGNSGSVTAAAPQSIEPVHSQQQQQPQALRGGTLGSTPVSEGVFSDAGSDDGTDAGSRRSSRVETWEAGTMLVRPCVVFVCPLPRFPQSPPPPRPGRSQPRPGALQLRA